MNIGLSLRSERPVLAVMLLALLPWVGVSLFSGGVWVAMNTGGYAILVFSTGYALISTALPVGSRSRAIFLAPAAGILLLSAFSAFWVRLGLPLVWISVLWIALTAGGTLGLWRDRGLLQRSTVSYGVALVVLSVVICAVYFFPEAINDAVLRPDGSFNWIGFDIPYFHSVAASIKYCNGPPTMPGTATAQLFYHFGPYAPAATISRLTGVNLGDALVRITRGPEQWALVFSCFGLGTLLSLKATGEKFGGVMSVVGLFFYGSLSMLFESLYNRYAFHFLGVSLDYIREGFVAGYGGPFDHLMQGHSCLHGLVAITVIMGLCLEQREQAAALKGWAFILLALPALVVPVNPIAALYCIGIVSILLFWGFLKKPRSWLAIMLIFGLFLGAWKLMGYGHNPDAAHATINPNPAGFWWALVVWFMVGLGFRILGFNWISLPVRDPVSALVLASVTGLLSFFIFVQLTRDGNQKYGLYFLQAMFSIFAFSRLAPGFWYSAERSKWVAEWLKMAKFGTLLLMFAGFLIVIAGHLTHHGSGISFIHLKLSLAFLLLLFLIGFSFAMKRSPRLTAAGSAIILGVLMIGFWAWVPVWLTLERGQRDLTITAGEVQGLKRLGKLAAPGERFATNKHEIQTSLDHSGKSYGYGALAELPVLLEGYLLGGEQSLPNFENLLHDNDLLFTTTNSDTLHSVASNYHVKWLVARPGTDISLPRPLPVWLDEQTNCGDLKIYRID